MIIVNNFFIILFLLFFFIIKIANINFKETENDKVGGSTWTPVKVNSDISPGPRKGHSMIYYQQRFRQR